MVNKNYYMIIIIRNSLYNSNIVDIVPVYNTINLIN